MADSLPEGVCREVRQLTGRYLNLAQRLSTADAEFVLGLPPAAHHVLARLTSDELDALVEALPVALFRVRVPSDALAANWRTIAAGGSPEAVGLSLATRIGVEE